MRRNFLLAHGLCFYVDFLLEKVSKTAFVKMLRSEECLLGWYTTNNAKFPHMMLKFTQETLLLSIPFLQLIMHTVQIFLWCLVFVVSPS